MNDNYKYNVFISWTGKNREEKNIIKKALIDNGIADIYDSETECKGDFRDDYTTALRNSKVYLIILSDHLLNDPNVSGGYFTQVKDEISLALDLETRGILNIAVFSCSPYFAFTTLPDEGTLGWFFYNRLNRLSQVRSYDPIQHEVNAGIIAGHVKDFLTARDNGKPKPSEAIRIPLIKYPLVENKLFSGRADEMKEIDIAFEKGSRIVILSGIGGIGKTEIAKKYVDEHRGQYFCPQQITLSDEDEKESGLGNLASRAKFEKEYDDKITSHMSKEEQTELKLRWLGELDERIILVIDNYNNIEEHNIKAILKHLKCKVILTTRVTNISSDMVKVIKIEKLPQDVAWQMFCKKLETNPNENIDERFDDLYKTIDGHTLTLCIIARMMKQQGLTLDHIIDEIKNPAKIIEIVDDFHNVEIQKKYEANKTLIGHLKTLFDLSGILTTEGKEYDKKRLILKSLSLIDLDGIKETSFKKACGLETANELIELSKLGWIERRTIENNDFSLNIHPLCSMLIIVDQKPSPDDVSGLVEYILNWADIDNETNYSKISKMKHRIGFMIEGFSQNKYSNIRLNALYADILYRLGEAKEAISVLREQEKSIQDPADKVTALVKATTISLNCGIDRFENFKYGVEALSTFNEKKDLRIAQFAVLLSNYSVQLRNKDEAIQLLIKAYDIAQSHKEPLLLTLITFQLISLGEGKTYINKTNAILKKINKQAAAEGVVFYAKITMLICSFFIKYSDKSGNLIENITHLLIEIDAIDNISITDFLNIKNIKNKIHLFFIEKKIESLIKKYKNIIPEDDPFLFLYKLFDNDDNEDSMADFFSKNLSELYNGLAKYFHEKGLYVVADFNDFVKYFNKILLSLENDKLKKLLLNNYNQLADNSNYTTDHNNLNSWLLVADGMLASGYLEEAICAYGNIYLHWHQIFPQKNFRKGEILQSLGDAFFKKNEYLIALDYYRKAINMFEETLPDSVMHSKACSSFINIILYYGNFNRKFGLYKEALKYIEIIIMVEANDKLAYLFACERKTSLLQNIGKYEDAEQYLKPILQGIIMKDFPIYLRKDLYSKLSYCYYLIKEYHNALLWNKKYFKLIKHNKTCNDIMRLAESYSNINNYNKALSLYIDALNTAFKKNEKEYLLKIKDNIGIVLNRIDNTEDWFVVIKNFSLQYRKINKKNKLKYFYRTAKENLAIIIGDFAVNNSMEGEKAQQEIIKMLTDKFLSNFRI
jgi:tetratricopeptide (TPR) repeat protein